MRRLRVCVLLLLAGLCLCACADTDAHGAGRLNSQGSAAVNAVAKARNLPISTSSLEGVIR